MSPVDLPCGTGHAGHSGQTGDPWVTNGPGTGPAPKSAARLPSCKAWLPPADRVLLTLAIPCSSWSCSSPRGRSTPARRAARSRGTSRSPGEDIGHLSEDRLAATGRGHRGEVRRTPRSQVRVAAKTYEVPAGLLGLHLDENETITARSTSTPTSRWSAARHVARLVRLRAGGAAALHGATTPSSSGACTACSGRRRPSRPSRRSSTPDWAQHRQRHHRSDASTPSGVREQLMHRAQSGEQPIVVRTRRPSSRSRRSPTRPPRRSPRRSTRRRPRADRSRPANAVPDPAVDRPGLARHQAVGQGSRRSRSTATRRSATSGRDAGAPPRPRTPPSPW